MMRRLKIALNYIISIFKSLRYPNKTTYIDRNTGKIINEKKIVIENTLPITVQVNGKLISKFIVDVNTNDETIRHLALADEYVKKFIEGKTIRKIIVAKRKLVNIIV